MGNLESEWNFDPATLALAKTPGYFALRVCAVDLKNAPQTAETLDKIKQCLAASQIAVETENIKVKPLRAGSTSTLQDVFIVARLLPKASKMIQLLCNGPAGAYRQLFDLKEIGGIPSKGAYDPRSKLAKLPFNGAKFATMALVRSVLCVTETHGAERAAFMMDQVLIPALTARLDAEADEKRRILAGHETKALDATADVVTRQRANDAMVSQAPYLASLAAVRLKLSDCFQILLVEPLMKHSHNALDSALGYATRDYDDQSVMKMRGQVCNGFRSGGSLMYIVKRTHFDPFEARVISFLSSQLLSMKLPEQFSKLPPVFVLSAPKLTAATSEPDSIAAQFATVELFKTKIHLLAGDSILNIDGENLHFGYDQLAVANITTESTDIYSVAHPFGDAEATKHLWIRGFHEAATLEGQAVSVEYTSEEFFIRELGTIEVGAASSVWDIGNCLCTANEYVKHTNLKVEPGLLQTTPRHNDRSGPTPASLTKLVEIHNLMPAIKLWSKQNAPNEVWAAAAASVGVDVDADSGSGRGGGAVEERFKALEDANAELRKKLDGVTSTVQELATTVKDIGTNVNQGFAQIMQSLQSSQQGQAALLSRIQGSDASIAMIGHAVAGLPGTTFAMPEPTAAAVTGYGGAGGTIANVAAADATNGAPMALETASETALVTVAPTIDPRLAGAPFSATTTTMGGGEGHNGAPACPELSDGLDDAEPTPCTASETRLGKLSRMVRRTFTRSATAYNADGTLGLTRSDGRRTGWSTNLTTSSDDGTDEPQSSKSRHEWGPTGMYVGPQDCTPSPRQVLDGKVTTEKSSDCVPSAPPLPPGAGAPMAPEHSDGLEDYDVPSRTVAAGETNFQRLRRIMVYAGTDSASTPEGSMERLGTVQTAEGRRSGRLSSLAATGGGTAAEDAETQAIVLHSLRVERMVAEQLRAALPPPTPDDFPETGGEALPGAEYEVDYVEPPAQFDATTAMINDDSGVVGVTQGTVEGTPTLEVLGSTAELAEPAPVRSEQPDHDCRTAGCRRQAPGPFPPSVCGIRELHCCVHCYDTNGARHSRECDAYTTEATLNDIEPAPMDF